LRHCSQWFKQIASISSGLCANRPLNAGTTSRRGRKAGRKPCWGEIGWGETAVFSDLEMRANTHMGTTFSHLLPGIAKFAAAAVTPWYSVDSILIRNAVILLLSFVILGAAIAIIARKVRPSTADSAFRRPVKSQGQSADWQMLQTLEQAIDEGSANLDFDIAGPIADPDQPAVNLPALIPAEAPQIDKVVAADSSSPWDETASSLMAAFAEPETGHESRPLTRSISEDAKDTAQKSTQNSARNSEPYHAQDPAAAPEENAPLALPRLSELRGMCFSQALRELDRAKRPAQPTPGSTTNPTPEIDVLLRAIAPFESLIMQMESVTPQTENTGSANEYSAKKYPPQSDFVSVKPVAPAKPRGQHGEDNGRSLPGRKPPGGVPDYLHPDHSHIEQSHVDQMHILPSRRGQYKKKT
jgi:hypothetical protein